MKRDRFERVIGIPAGDFIARITAEAMKDPKFAQQVDLLKKYPRPPKVKRVKPDQGSLF